MMCSSVDLPEPEGPISVRNSPAWISSEIRLSAAMRVSPCSYIFERVRIETIAPFSPTWKKFQHPTFNIQRILSWNEHSSFSNGHAINHRVASYSMAYEF